MAILSAISNRNLKGSMDINIKLIQEWLREAGRIALDHQKKLSFRTKPDKSIVTNIDYEIEAFLCERIKLHYKKQNILSEEGMEENGQSDYVWIIDPIDGTRAYVSQLPVWGISIGIFKKDRPWAGVFYLPFTHEMFWSANGLAYYNNSPLLPLDDTDLHNPCGFIAVPSSSHLEFDISFPRLRSLGSTAAHLAYVARGLALASLIRRIKIWDIAGILPVLDAVGVTLLDLTGKPFQVSELLQGIAPSLPLIAAPMKIAQEVLSYVQTKHHSSFDAKD
jgi:myo-inositol-1(or 4)-monophosphatase